MQVSNLVQKEKEWHDNRFADHSREREARVGRFYSVARKAQSAYVTAISNQTPGTVLEYGCGPGGQAFRLARDGWNVSAIDISSVVITQAREEAARAKLNIDFVEMDAHSLRFEPDSFDLICGSGILHHLVIDKALSEILRVIKPGGRAVFREPLGHNLFINAFRRRTPSLRTEDEHPLLRSDLQMMERRLGPLDVRFFCLATLGAAFLWKRPGFSVALGAAEMLDKILLRIPGLKFQAWQVVIVFQKHG
jgi:SAM-dependent methyltransferase